jgi:site-specific DNA-methyltransferase (adenine-specific)
MPELEVREMAVADLVPYANNAKKHPKEQIDQIAESISEFGNCDPIAVWHNEDGEAEIVEGHGRVMALKQLGIETAPVICLDHLTDEQRRAYTHVHNQTTLSSGFDEQALIEDMDNLDMDWEALGFSEFMPDFEHDDIEDEGMPEEVVCRCKRGDVWMLGAHRVKCGSSTDPDDMADLLRGGVADLIVTDPPYNVALGQHDRPSEAKQLHRRTDGLVIANDSWDNDEDFIEFLRSAFELGMDALKPGGAFYIWHADTQRMNFLKACERAGMTIRECLVWVKNVFTLGRQDYQWRHEPCLYGWKDGASHQWYSDRKQSTVLEFDKPSSNSEHPTMKPIPLIAYQIENSSKKGDLVLDMFGGSGSTLIACEKLGRKCVTMELDPHYCDVIISRWEEMTGQRATLEE